MPVKLDVNNSYGNSDQADHDQEENEFDLEFEGDESCDDEFSPTSGEESKSDEGHQEDNEARNLVTLSSDKPIQDQLKFIICEESMATTFRICFNLNAEVVTLFLSEISLEVIANSTYPAALHPSTT